MIYVSWLNEIGFADQDRIGAKAAGLGELIRAGFAVPRGFCINARAHREAFAAQQLNEKIIAHLGEIDVSDPAQLEQAAEEIRGWIEDMPLSSELEREIQTALAALNAAMVAVRASRVVEDVPNPAASGLQQAFLAIPTLAVLSYIRKCWAMPWNSRAIYFRHRKKITPDKVNMAVVVQTMINPDAAGVMFTASPMGKNTGEIHIDAVWGLGEAVIAARWRPDHFVVDKATGAVREKQIASKTVMNTAAAEGGVQTVRVPVEKQGSSCLTDAQIATLAETGKRVEAHFKELQDIEWAHSGEGFFILQARSMKN